MRFDQIIRRGQDFLNSPMGRTVGGKAADIAAGAARKAMPKQATTIDRAQRAAHDYINRQGNPGTGRSTMR